VGHIVSPPSGAILRFENRREATAERWEKSRSRRPSRSAQRALPKRDNYSVVTIY